ncbi:hypothetical protein Csa_008134 [Cucumis sativus]|uniref:Uncharacterized protein n=1 Tax=Cucumis sativus TaxID=3659 RepID=A0A0A0KR87_CUCSA|nr:hypothetical protein Csa_008134 [Cucumis sativus]
MVIAKMETNRFSTINRPKNLQNGADNMTHRPRRNSHPFSRACTLLASHQFTTVGVLFHCSTSGDCIFFLFLSDLSLSLSFSFQIFHRSFSLIC